jgi:hypothetical protein
MFLEKKKRINVKPKSQFDLELSHKFFFFLAKFCQVGIFFPNCRKFNAFRGFLVAKI